jgi:hypothetical protein
MTSGLMIITDGNIQASIIVPPMFHGAPAPRSIPPNDMP